MTWEYNTKPLEEIPNDAVGFVYRIEFTDGTYYIGRKNFYSDDALGRAYYIISSLESATTLTLNEENWPEIKGHISSAMSTIFLITHFHTFKIDQDYHDELVRRAAAMPAELDGHLEKLQDDQFRRSDLEKLAHELRTMAFKPLVLQHPQFDAGLKEISLDLRRHVLRWANNTPKNDEAISIVRDIRERLAQLLDKYGPHNDPKR